MATIANLMVRIGGDIANLEKSLSKAQRKIQDAGRSMSRVGSRLTMAVTAPLAGVGGMALKTAADFESLQQSMNTLNGSVEEGTRNFRRLQEFSATTPFQLSELAEAQNMLQGFGQSADDAFQSVQMIGDIAAVASGDIKGIGIAFGQASAEGRLMTRDIRQLINQGVPAIKLLSETMGVAKSEVLDLASEGEISFEILQRAFREATTEGGMFANGMAKQANTLAGRFSTMKDNIALALGAVGDTMSGLAKGLMNQVIDISQAFRNLDESTKQMITTAGMLAAAIPPLIWVVGKLTIALGALFSPITGVIAAIAGLVVVGKNMYDNWEVITANLNQLWDGVKLTAWIVVDGIFDAFSWMADNILGVLSQMASAVSPALTMPLEMARTQIKLAGESINDTLESSRKEFDKSAIAAFKAESDMTSLSDSFWSITDAIQGGLTSGLNFLSDQLFSIADGAGAASDAMSFDTNIEKAGFPNPLQNVEFGELERVSSKFDSIRDAMGKVGNEAKVMGQALQQAATGAITSFAETLGNAFTGDAGASGFFNNLLMIVVDFANQFGKLLVAAGVAAQAFKSLLANPFAAIAAGTALIAATTAVKNLLQKGPKQEAPALAQGGLAFGPTMAVVGDNRNARSDPEVIAPLSKLQGIMANSGGGTTRVEGIIRGSDIHLANERGKNKFR